MCVIGSLLSRPDQSSTFHRTLRETCTTNQSIPPVDSVDDAAAAAEAGTEAVDGWIDRWGDKQIDAWAYGNASVCVVGLTRTKAGKPFGPWSYNPP